MQGSAKIRASSIILPVKNHITAFERDKWRSLTPGRFQIYRKLIFEILLHAFEWNNKDNPQSKLRLVVYK